MAELKLKRKTKAEIPTRKRRQAVTRSLHMNDDSDEHGLDQEGEKDDCVCILQRSKPGEGWLRCMRCSRWVHATCADLPKRNKLFVRELCN
ncbi:hypothetical protein HHI36_013415, partial [Cryptolaemus montrouzieri]